MVPQKGEPRQGDLILHECNGKVRRWLPAGRAEVCRGCKSPLAGDVPYRYGHAHIVCTVCQSPVGVCAGELLDEVAAAAARVLSAADKRRRRKEEK
jgi:hypothetical protein